MTVYVDDTVSSSGDGSSWAQALKTFAEGGSQAASGEEIWIANTHHELLSANTTYTLASKVKVLSVNKANNEYLAGAHLDSSGGVFDIIFGGFDVMYTGINLTVGDDLITSNNAVITINDSQIMTTGNGSFISNSGLDASLIINNSTIDATLNTVNTSGVFASVEGSLVVTNCTVLGTVINATTNQTGNVGVMSFTDCDFSGLQSTGTGKYLCSNGASTTDGNFVVKFSRCVLPPNIASWLKEPDTLQYKQLEVVSCTRPDFLGANDDNDAMWFYYRVDHTRGEIIFDTETYLSDVFGAVSYSVELDGTGCSPSNVLRHKLCSIPASDLATSKVVTFYFTSDATLNTAQFYPSLVRPDASDNVLGFEQSLRPADIIGAGSPHTVDSGSAWTNGKTNTYEASITIPALTGVNDAVIDVYANLTLANTSVWVDPNTVRTDA